MVPESKEEGFAPDIDYMRLAYIDRRDFGNQLGRNERISDEALEREFDEWVEGIRAKAWLEGLEYAKKVRKEPLS